MAQILVVDDEMGIRELLSEILTDEGHSVALAENAAAARKARGDKRPDLVLLDIMLPEISGYEIVEAMRADAGLRGVRVLMMTARGSVVERRRGLALGADGFIAKPFELAELRAEMARLLGA